MREVVSEINLRPILTLIKNYLKRLLDPIRDFIDDVNKGNLDIRIYTPELDDYIYHTVDLKNPLIIDIQRILSISQAADSIAFLVKSEDIANKIYRFSNPQKYRITKQEDGSLIKQGTVSFTISIDEGWLIAQILNVLLENKEDDLIFELFDIYDNVILTVRYLAPISDDWHDYYGKGFDVTLNSPAEMFDSSDVLLSDHFTVSGKPTCWISLPYDYNIVFDEGEYLLKIGFTLNKTSRLNPSVFHVKEVTGYEGSYEHINVLDSYLSLEEDNTGFIFIKLSLANERDTDLGYYANFEVYGLEGIDEFSIAVTIAKKNNKYIDLGLSVNWGLCNIGANTPYEVGKYFQWGDSEGYTAEEVGVRKVFTWSNYKYCNGTSTTLTKYCTNSKYGTVDDKTSLDLQDDGAYVELRDNWRIPTYDEWVELMDACDYGWTTQNGVPGCLFTLKSDPSKTLFLPSNGYTASDGVSIASPNSLLRYHSRTLSTSDISAYIFGIKTGGATDFVGDRYIGRCIRPVYYRDGLPIDYVNMGLTVNWATCNLGASLPYEYGAYYAFGETAPYDKNRKNLNDDSQAARIFNYTTYKWCNGSNTSLTKYVTNSSYGTVDNLTELEDEDDPVVLLYGGEWKTPTEDQYKELIDSCILEWTTNYNGTGVTGIIFTSMYNGNKIFLPAMGSLKDNGLSNDRLWCLYNARNINQSTNYENSYLRIDSNLKNSNVALYKYWDRAYARPIRPVIPNHNLDSIHKPTFGDPVVVWYVQTGTWNESSESNALDGKKFVCESPGASKSTTIRCIFSNALGRTITFVYRSDAESTYDYLNVGELDTACTRTAYKDTTKGALKTNKEISFSITDANEHYVEFCFSKDGTVDTSPDNATVYLKA